MDRGTGHAPHEDNPMHAMESPKKRALKLHITCRECHEGFRWYLAPAPVDITITCPFCAAFILVIVENFSLGAVESPATERRYRI